MIVFSREMTIFYMRMAWKDLLINLWGIFWMLLFFGGSIFIHEFGHFIMAKKRGLQVPKFSIGFGPKLFSWKRGETEYCIALLPLGGYVALPQMGEIPVLEGKPSHAITPLSFTDKFLVAVMGAMFNLLLAFVLACILWVVGLRVPAQDRTTEIGYILPEYQGEPTPAVKGGLQKGDKILAVDDVAVETFSDIEKAIILGSRRNKDGVPQVKITYKRNGHFYNTLLDLRMIETNPLTKDEIRFSGILAPRQPLQVEGFEAGSSGEKSGLKLGDILLKVDDVELYSFVDLRGYLNDKKPQQVRLQIKRGNEITELVCDVKSEPYQRAWLHYGTEENYVDFYDHDGQICVLETGGTLFSAIPRGGALTSCNGIKIDNLDRLEQILSDKTHRTIMLEIAQKDKQLIAVRHEDNGVQKHDAESIQRLGVFFAQPTIIIHENPIKQFKQAILSTVETLTSLANKNSDVKVQHLMGAPGIMRLLHRFSTNDFRRLLWFIVLLNINLAILNLLPIPVLDGGHILFASIEKILRRPLPQNIVLALQNVFVMMFLGLMAYVIFFDVRRWQGDIESEHSQQRMEKLMIPIDKAK
ncbi:MAG: site-2 protease family protein [bacterium]